MPCHDVCKISQALRCMSVCPDVDMDSASPCGIALGSCMSELSYEFLKKFDVFVMKDRCDQFAFLIVRSRNADVLLEFPFPSICIPCRPCIISVSGSRVFKSSCSEEYRCNLCSPVPSDVIHLNLDPDGLFFHFLDLSCCLFVHGMYLRLFSFPFGRYIFALKHTYIQLYRTHKLYKDFN